MWPFDLLTNKTDSTMNPNSNSNSNSENKTNSNTPEGTVKTIEQLEGLLGDESKLTRKDVAYHMLGDLDISDKKVLACTIIEECKEEARLEVKSKLDDLSEERGEFLGQLEVCKDEKAVLVAEVEEEFADDAGWDKIKGWKQEILDLQDKIDRCTKKQKARLKIRITQETSNKDKTIASIQNNIDRIDKLSASLELSYQAPKSGIPCKC